MVRSGLVFNGMVHGYCLDGVLCKILSFWLEKQQSYGQISDICMTILQYPNSDHCLSCGVGCSVLRFGRFCVLPAWLGCLVWAAVGRGVGPLVVLAVRTCRSVPLPPPGRNGLPSLKPPSYLRSVRGMAQHLMLFANLLI